MPSQESLSQSEDHRTELEAELEMARDLGWELSRPVMELHGSASELPAGSKVLVARLIEPDPSKEERVHLELTQDTGEDDSYAHQAIEAIEKSIDRLSELWADGEKLNMVADKQRDWKNPRTGEWMVN